MLLDRFLVSVINTNTNHKRNLSYEPFDDHLLVRSLVEF